MSKSVEIGPNLTVPIDVVTESTAIIGRRGSGKTYTAAVLAEGMLAAGQQVVALDPTNAWWGLRSSADGTQPGFPIAIFGGQRGDMPLEDTMGPDLADAIIESRLSAVVCVRDFSNAGVRRFVGDFAERLYERKCEGKFRTPIHLFIDEADAVVPQRIQKGGERAYGAIDKIVRRGRIDGFGTSLISQRPAVINKDVLTQTEVLVAHQVTGPHDQKALLAWVEEHGTDEQRREFLSTLASLKKGQAWWWSPAWLELFQLVTTRARTTWNSSQTPKVGEVLPEPKRSAQVDIEAIRKALERKPGAAKKAAPAASGDGAHVAELEALRAENAKLREVVADANRCREALIELLRQLSAVLDVPFGEWTTSGPEEPKSSTPPPKGPAPPVRRAVAESSIVLPKEVAELFEPAPLSKAARLLLTAIVQLGTLTLEQAAITAGYAPNSGGIRNAAGELRAAGFVEGGNTTGLAVTKAGRAAVGNAKPLPTGQALLDFWSSKLGKAEREILARVVRAYPKPMSLQEAARACGYEPTSGGIRNAAGRLRTLALVTGGNSGMVANERLVK